MTRVICIGECMVERRPVGAEAFAGDAFNVAAHIKQCAPSFQVAFASVTGDDAESEWMRQAWTRFGVDGLLSPAIPAGRIGAYSVDTDAVGERRFSYDRANSAARRWFEQLEPRGEAMAGADLVFLSGVSLAILPLEQRLPAVAFVAGLKAKTLAFDPNVRQVLWESREAMAETLEAAMARADVLLPSLDDLRELWGEESPEALLERCQALGASEVALTLGASGCLLYAGGEPPVHLPVVAAKVVDTAGAGDAFDGAYMAFRLCGRSPKDAVRAGLARATRIVSLRGALPMELFPCR